ncbi:hypothetical protein TNCV_4839231, partial [Trichonephila clavipes]
MYEKKLFCLVKNVGLDVPITPFKSYLYSNILVLGKYYQLDGLRVSKKKHSSMEDYLQLPDDYEERKCEPGKKR